MYKKQQETSYLEATSVLYLILKWKKPLLIVTIVAVAASVIFSGETFIPPKFKSTVILFPASTSSISKAVIVVPAIIISLCCYFYSSDIMTLLYHQEDINASAAVFRILMSCFVAISFTYIFGTLLTANGNLKQLNIMASIGMVINFTMNMFFIPKLLSLGAATSSLVTQYLIALSQIIMVQLIFKFKINYRFIIAFIIFIPAVVGVNILMQSQMANHLMPSLPANLASHAWMVKLAVTAILCFGLAFALRLIRPKNIYLTFRYEE